MRSHSIVSLCIIDTELAFLVDGDDEAVCNGVQYDLDAGMSVTCDLLDADSVTCIVGSAGRADTTPRREVTRRDYGDDAVLSVTEGDHTQIEFIIGGLLCQLLVPMLRHRSC
jgi:hypothetical protein